MSSASLQVELPCSCGRAVAVQARDAGSKIECSCGKLIEVPLLSRLRQMAGRDAYVTNPADAIRKMQQAGINPAGDVCLHCGATSPVQIKFIVECERPQANTKNRGFWHLLSIFNLFGFVGLFQSNSYDREFDAVGHEVKVTLLLPMCSNCQASIGDIAKPDVAARVLKQVPAYAELLAYYPQAQWAIER